MSLLENIPEYEPLEITQGERLTWKKTLTDYQASDWTLSYRFRGPGDGFNVTATADGEDFLIEVSTTETAKPSPGKYRWQAWVTNQADSTETYHILSGEVTVLRGFAENDPNDFDLRSDAKKILDAIDAAMLSKATSDQLEYEISTPAGSRRLKRLSMTELESARRLYASIVSREHQAERLRQGGKFFKQVNVRLRDEGA